MSRFPQVIDSTSAASSTSNSTTFTITFPATSILAGDLVVIFFSVDANETPAVTTGTNWNRLGYASYSTTVTGAVFWKVYTANGPETVVITTTSEQASWVTYLIRGHDPYSATVVTGTSMNATGTDPDPASHTPTAAWGDQDYLWIVSCARDSTSTCSAAPTDFGNLIAQAGGGTSGAGTCTARREYRTGSAYDPGAFTASTSIAHVCWTVCIAPIMSHGSTTSSIWCPISIS